MEKWSISKLVLGMLSLITTAVALALDTAEVAKLDSKWWMPITIGIFYYVGL
jgi:hypothetical protein